MSKARERQKKRRQNRDMVRRGGSRQTRREGSFEMPKIRIPGGRLLLGVALSAAILFGAIFGLREINPPDVEFAPNALWLDTAFTYTEHTEDELKALNTTLNDNQIGHLFLYVSSLDLEGAWSGLPDGQNRFSEVEQQIQRLTGSLHDAIPGVTLYAWIEIAANTPEGYRLDSSIVRNATAGFAQRMIERDGFDGVLLDVKPIFEENEDFRDLVRTVRASIGLDTPLFVAVPPDLTPSDTDLNLPSVIAPGTEWGEKFKQAVALQADGVVINAYNSYHTNPVDYIEWVSYQVQAYVDAISREDTGAQIYVSVPNFEENKPAHDASIESLPAGLDGVRRGVSSLDVETQLPLFAGVAIYTDHTMTDGEWVIFADKWLNGG